MRVYKCFFRILKKQKGQILLYLGIFMALSILVSSQGSSTENAGFEAKNYSFAIFDEDQSEISKQLVKYLEKDNKRVDIKDDKDVIQDELYSRSIKCAVRIPKGFGDALKDGKGEKMIEVSSVPGTVYGETFENKVNGFSNIVRSYIEGGFSDSEAVEKAKITSDAEINVEMTDSGNDGSHSRIFYFFNYVPYVFVALCVSALTPIMIVFRKKEVRERIESSSFPANKINLQLFAGTVTAGVALCFIHVAIVSIFVQKELFTFHGLLYILNELSFLVVALGIVLLLGMIIDRQNVISMAATVIALGLSFLGGVFIPTTFLGAGVLKAAHFLPSYWFVRAGEQIDAYKIGSSTTEIFGFMGIQLLFGVAFICIGLAFSRVRVKK